MIGECETAFGTIMGSMNQVWTGKLIDPKTKKHNGEIIVRVDSVKDANWEARFRPMARLPAAGCCGSNI
jgi:hypothetical protein